MKTWIPFAALSFSLLLLAGCSGNPEATAEAAPAAAPAPTLRAKYLPKDEQVLMIIGEDLGAGRDYMATNQFPTPGGLTTYVNFVYSRDAEKQYGGWGIDNDLAPADPADWWGSGQHSAGRQLHPS